MWVRSSNDVGLYPCDRLSAAPEGVFLRYPENKKCSFCNLVVSPITFESHVRKYPSGDCQFSHKCSTCTKIFKNLISLQSHICDVIDINLKQCPYCKNNFSSRHILKNTCQKILVCLHVLIVKIFVKCASLKTNSHMTCSQKCTLYQILKICLN
uniref:(northern house mosquito) hypothetical protein n=1 Tax=Culex pipiens TaxID=7175 RepID=A0A8D8DEQ1_CULPI